MRKNIGLNMIEASVVDPRSGRPMTATIAFKLSFSGEHPAQVQKVTNELMSLYLKENLKERSEQANATYLFLKGESERLEKEVSALQEKLAAFKEQHANSLPELQQLNQSMLERTETEISNIENQIRVQEQSRVYLKSQLSLLKPFESDTTLDPRTRLQTLRAQYLSLLARYSTDHPDVIRTRREIEGLEKETGKVDSTAEQLKQIELLRGELGTLREKYSPEHPDVIKLTRQIEALEQSVANSPEETTRPPAPATENADNPAYIQIQTQIKAVNSEISSLRNKQARLKEKQTDYEQRLVETPQVEREYFFLRRDLRDTLNEHENIRTKLISAEIAQELEKDSKGERFVIIEPPILPQEPVSPNRPAILFLSLALALGAGIGYAALRESLDDRVRSSKALSFAVGATPLAVIPYVASDTEVRKHKRTVTTRAAAAAAAVILSIAMLHYFWTPLDVLWYKVLRKADTVVNT